MKLVTIAAVIPSVIRETRFGYLNQSDAVVAPRNFKLMRRALHFEKGKGINHTVQWIKRGRQQKSLVVQLDRFPVYWRDNMQVRNKQGFRGGLM